MNEKLLDFAVQSTAESKWRSATGWLPAELAEFAVRSVRILHPQRPVKWHANVGTNRDFCPVPKKLMSKLVPKQLEHTYVDHGVDVTFVSGELHGILDADQDDEVEVVPHVVLVADVILEADGFVVELRPVQSADEARVPQNLLLLLFLAPQIGERVDDDTGNQVQNDNDHHEEEEQVADDSCSKHRFLQTARRLIIVIVFIYIQSKSMNLNINSLSLSK